MEETFETVAPSRIGTDVLAVAEGEPLRLDLRLESVMEGVLVSGDVHARATGVCVRCLDDISDDVDVEFQELFAYADRRVHHAEVGDGDEDQRIIEGDLIDLEPAIVDAVVLALPFQPLCREDCPGLCSQCGARLADDPDHTHDDIDPRWAALSSLSGEGGRSGDNEYIEEKRN